MRIVNRFGVVANLANPSSTSPRNYWLRAGNGGIVIPTPQTLNGTWNIKFLAKIIDYTGTSAARPLQKNDLSTYLFVYDSAHSSLANAVVVKTSTVSVTWANAWPSDRSSLYDLELDVVSDVGTLIVDGVTYSSEALGGNFIIENAAIRTQNNSIMANIDINAVQNFPVNEGTGTSAIDSLGGDPGTLSGGSWIEE